MTFEYNLSPKLLWEPKNSENCEMNKFRMKANEKFGLKLKNYADLYQWSISDLSSFWSLVWEYTNIISSSKFTKVFEEDKKMSEIPKWFLGAKLNFAENLLRYRDDRIALIGLTEANEPTRVSYKELAELVRKWRNSLSTFVGKNDVVLSYLPTGIDAVVLLLACSSIGAIYTSSSPDFGPQGVLDRAVQVNPKLIVSVDSVLYNGKVYEHLDKVKVISAKLNCPVVLCKGVPSYQLNTPLSDLPNYYSVNDFLQRGDQTEELKFEQLPFDHPLYILYSSGTTGIPKCIVHGSGGSLIQHLKEHIILGDMCRDDVFLQYTTTGWMMFNWLVSALAVGCTVILYDGSPLKPVKTQMFDILSKYKVTKFGTSAKFIQILQDENILPLEPLPHLKDIYST
jgi:acetoacetyl-CoA synthetase